VTVVYKEKKTHFKVSDLQPIYRGAAGEQVSSVMWFKKTLKVDVAKIAKVVAQESEDDPVWQVTMKDGGDETLTPLPKATINDKPAVFEGLLGRVPAGYKLFPGHVISEVHFDTSDPPPDKDKDKDK
jgi:hypothetical protein